VSLIVGARRVGRQQVARHCIVSSGDECIANDAAVLTGNQNSHAASSFSVSAFSRSMARMTMSDFVAFSRAAVIATHSTRRRGREYAAVVDSPSFFGR